MSLQWLSDSRRDSLSAIIRVTLPSNYLFEIEKTLNRLRKFDAHNICLQFPEGLMRWAESIALIIEEYGYQIENVYILGDVTYGACCIDDTRAFLLGCDYLVHYGHSCLVSITSCKVKCLYVFVEILFDTNTLIDSATYLVKTLIFKPTLSIENQSILMSDKEDSYSTMIGLPEKKKVAILSTIQYASTVNKALKLLRQNFDQIEWTVPQRLPLTNGEVLGCTSSTINADYAIFVADGRFHIESAMLQNPKVKFFRFDPMTKKIFDENYDHASLYRHRNYAIHKASECKKIVFLLSTLGRQGSFGIAERLMKFASCTKLPLSLVLINEINFNIINKIGDALFVNIGCPRLSIDWSCDSTNYPFLSTYEFYQFMNYYYGLNMCSFNEKSLSDGMGTFRGNTQEGYGKTDVIDKYEMDYFAKDGGPWANYHNNENRDGSLSDKNIKPLSLQEQWLNLNIKKESCLT